jgi:dolichol-phosphate mannosyltransferase
LSKICAAEIAMINNFIWNELWTFKQSASPVSPLLGERDGVRASQSSDITSCGVRSRFRSGLLRRFLLFNAICGIGIGLAVLLLHLFYSWLGWNLYVSNLLAIVVVTSWNFGMNARFNWRYQALRV